VNHLVVNGGVVACGYGEERADSLAAEILAEAYPGRRVVTVDARPILARGGGVHCITQQQPRTWREAGLMARFDVVEASIAQLRAALESGATTCES
jgi:hypothetical protein